MFKAIRYEKQILIVLFWSVLAFVGYNILTAEAATKEKDMVDAIRGMEFTNDDLDDYGLKELAIEQACKDNGGQWKDNNWCNFDKIGEQDEVEFEHQLEERGLSYYYADKEYLGDEWDKYQQEKYEKSQKGVEEKKYDKDEYVNGITPDENSDAEKYSDDSREQAHRYCAQLDYYDNNKKFCEKLAKGEDNTVFATEQGLKGEELETEIAAQEDALCDNEDADTTKIEICMSDEQKESKKIGKDECKEVNGDWKYGRCTFYEDYQSYEEEQQQKQEAAAEDLPNKLSPFYNSEPALSEEEKEDFEEGFDHYLVDEGLYDAYQQSLQDQIILTFYTSFFIS